MIHQQVCRSLHARWRFARNTSELTKRSLGQFQKLTSTLSKYLLIQLFTFVMACCHLVLFSDEEELLIERDVRTGMINPGDHWQTILHDGPVARLMYRIRVRCNENYYGNKCNKLCVPRNDYFGHYRCESSGAQVCLDGWMGPDCRTGEIMAR